MSIADYRVRLQSKYVRTCAEYLFRRPFAIESTRPLISFTFDDFPRTALSVGGSILHQRKLAGTYYVSLDLAGKEDASGSMFTLDDLRTAREQGHELGCHTFDHFDSGGTPTNVYVESVRANQRAFEKLFPGERFRTFSYPKSAPRGRTKQLTARNFDSCRGGGQAFNTGITDLNYLRAFFIEQAQGDMQAMRDIIDANRAANGWLIFATHDVCDAPSPYGCTPAIFEAVVDHAVQSGATILPVTAALETLR
jgi:peptidoglycan/xylan/chitin deacetylase (PgdA/CDA1 family)